MDKTLIIVEVEYDGIEYIADCYIHSKLDTEYGADADGNRAIAKAIIHDVVITSLYKEKNGASVDLFNHPTMIELADLITDKAIHQWYERG